MHAKITLKFADDIRVVVPDSLDVITTYVLREQGDWFEDEIKFVRLLLKPGDQAIDIGANYGLFTLSIARIVGAGGKVWAFEPASSTAALLSESVGINDFKNVVVDQRALSDRAGSAQLTLNASSELNELARDHAPHAASETVALVSLDGASLEHGWSGIDFLKIDAEGEEAAIIAGGRDFFQNQSPLVQYEVKAGSTVNLQLVQAFAGIGYTTYRLVPGLGALMPFDPQGGVDGALLNLFCCKPDRAAKLAAEGRLVLAEECQSTSSQQMVDDVLHGRESVSIYGWRQRLTALPYGALLAQDWEETVAKGESSEVENALALHAMAHDSELPVAVRFNALKSSLEILTSLCNERPAYLRLASLAKVAREFGARMVAVWALDNLLRNILKHRSVNSNEPFLLDGTRFDDSQTKSAIGNWVVCTVLEEIEKGDSFSSLYARDPAATRQRLIDIRNYGFGSPEMARRLVLVEQKFFGVSGAFGAFGTFAITPR